MLIEVTLFFIKLVYIIAALWLAVYAFNNWILTFIYWRYRHQSPRLPRFSGEQYHSDSLPPVTVQLPIYNEAEVVERLIKSVVKLDYPAHLLQIQLLDDSTDQTRLIAQSLVEQYQYQGINITYLHRQDRSEFKAGALQKGLETATGEFIAMFDADFIPSANYLQKIMPYFLSRPNLAFIQTRWGHINPTYSFLTGAQSVALDGHFGVEQVARNRSGLMINFNGTGGVWRRVAIQDVGGWQGETVSEDLDLSYRVQLKGWDCLYIRDVVAPAELPPQLAAFKRQQYRWAKGSIQCLKKLGQSLLQSDKSAWVKYQALLYLTGYLIHPLMIILLLVSLPLILQGKSVVFPLAYLTILSFAPPTLFIVGILSLYGRQAFKRLSYLPILILLGSGIALNNTKAIFEAILGVENTFRRTPKFNIERKTDQWQQSSYKLWADKLIFFELGLSLYAVITAIAALQSENYLAIPFIMLYALSFSYVGGLGLWEMQGDFRLWVKHFFKRKSVSKPMSRNPASYEYSRSSRFSSNPKG